MQINDIVTKSENICVPSIYFIVLIPVLNLTYKKRKRSNPPGIRVSLWDQKHHVTSQFRMDRTSLLHDLDYFCQFKPSGWVGGMVEVSNGYASLIHACRCSARRWVLPPALFLLSHLTVATISP